MPSYFYHLIGSLFLALTSAQTTASISATSLATGALSTLSTIAASNVSIPTGSYITYSSTVTLSLSVTSAANVSTNGTALSTSASSHSNVLVGSSRASTGTATGSSVAPQNTQPCNNYAEFCSRKYSNLTFVCAHNSAFAIKNNIFSNQDVSITGQLNDGIRMIQGETHHVNNTIYNCHTSCDFLNAGTYESLLTTVRLWLDANPYDVVTLLIVNSDYVSPTLYEPAFTASGMLKYVYRPPKIPMALNDWPTLSELILANTRAIVFMDYQANQTAVPYILDEFSQMAESPFSPTDPAFPCDMQRPPGITRNQTQNRLYLANHNLNVAISLGGSDILIPNFSDLSDVNSVNGTSGLGTMAQRCKTMYAGRSPNFLLVDYYDVGNYTVGSNGDVRNGSVFEVAAMMNGVEYNRPCCGLELALTSGASFDRGGSGALRCVAAAVLSVVVIMVMA